MLPCRVELSGNKRMRNVGFNFKNPIETYASINLRPWSNDSYSISKVLEGLLCFEIVWRRRTCDRIVYANFLIFRRHFSHTKHFCRHILNLVCAIWTLPLTQGLITLKLSSLMAVFLAVYLNILSLFSLYKACILQKRKNIQQLSVLIHSYSFSRFSIKFESHLANNTSL